MHHLNRQFKRPQMQTFHVRRSIKISKTIAGKKEKHAWLPLQPSYNFAEKNPHVVVGHADPVERSNTNSQRSENHDSTSGQILIGFTGEKVIAIRECRCAMAEPCSRARG